MQPMRMETSGLYVTVVVFKRGKLLLVIAELKYV